MRHFTRKAKTRTPTLEVDVPDPAPSSQLELCLQGVVGHQGGAAILEVIWQNGGVTWKKHLNS